MLHRVFGMNRGVMPLRMPARSSDSACLWPALGLLKQLELVAAKEDPEEVVHRSSQTMVILPTVCNGDGWDAVAHLHDGCFATVWSQSGPKSTVLACSLTGRRVFVQRKPCFSTGRRRRVLFLFTLKLCFKGCLRSLVKQVSCYFDV